MESDSRENHYERVRLTNNTILDRANKSENLDNFDKSVMRGIFKGQPSVEPGGEYFDSLVESAEMPDVDLDSVCSVGISMAEDIYARSPKARGMVLGYLNAVNGLDDLPLPKAGRRGNDATAGAAVHFMRLTLLTRMEINSSTEKVMHSISGSLEKAKADASDSIQEGKISSIIKAMNTLAAGFENRKYLDYMVGKFNEESELTPEEYADIRVKSRLLTEEAMRQRKYGTKSAYIEASIGGSWIFHDGHDWVQKMTKGRPAKGQYDNIAAVVEYSERDTLRDLRFGFAVDEDGSMRRTGNESDGTRATFYIGKDGTISLDPHGLDNLRLGLGLSESQELGMQAEIASNFYDLSMPIYRHIETRTSPDSERDRRDPDFSPIKDLLIPRIRRLNQPLSDDEVTDDITRTVRRHDVVWFVRRLPKGWHASLDAVAKAQKHGIELEDNETFVRSHIRGAGNKVLGHHAIKRSERK